MKSQLFSKKIIVLAIIFVTVFNLGAQNLPSSGIGFRGIHWNVKQNTQNVQVITNLSGSEVSVAGYGGSIFFFSRIYEQLFLEFNLGIVANVNNSFNYWNGGDVDVSNVIPILMGVRYSLLPAGKESMLKPYLEAGVGAYLIEEVGVGQKHYIEHGVSVGSNTYPGLYAGAGLNFMFWDNIGLNVNARYHLVDFKSKKYESGIEFGLGFIIMWGDYK
jgi:outer membrane protein W